MTRGVPFKKGSKKPPTSGRKKGTRNKKTVDISNMIDRALGVIDTKLESDIKKLSPTCRITMFENLAEYKTPKRARVNENGEAINDLNVHIVRNKPESSEGE